MFTICELLYNNNKNRVFRKRFLKERQPMEFRPCIDIHNGQVKQIVGGTLKDQGNHAVENFISSHHAEFYADMYRQRGLKGGHVILLNAADSTLYSATKEEAFRALGAYPGGLQVGGGITDENASMFLDEGASHVIVTSFIFQKGQIRYDHIEQMERAVGKEKLVIDVSCRMRDGIYYVVTDRWQHYTEVPMTAELLKELSGSCDEFLVHAVDVEGRSAGIDEEIVRILADYSKPQEAAGIGEAATGCSRPNAVTYAGGIAAYEDIDRLRRLGEDRVHATIGSALDLFGGPLQFDQVVQYFHK